MSTGISVILCVVAGLLLLLGFLGTFVPVLPGAPLAWAGLLAAYFSDFTDISDNKMDQHCWLWLFPPACRE